MAKGSYFGVKLASPTLDGTCAKLEASGAEVVWEPTEQPYGRSRLRLPRSRGQHGPDPGAALSRPEEVFAMAERKPAKKGTQMSANDCAADGGLFSSSLSA
jgi:hypothetical protein